VFKLSSTKFLLTMRSAFSLCYQDIRNCSRINIHFQLVSSQTELVLRYAKWGVVNCVSSAHLCGGPDGPTLLELPINMEEVGMLVSYQQATLV